MSSAAEFHPELRRAAKAIPRQLITPFTLPLFQRLTRLHGRQKAKDVEVLTLNSGVGIRLHRPATTSGAGPALLWIHGGGYIIGSAAQDDVLCRRFARTLGVTVAAVDYRLAPQNPYPAGLEDCYSALAWLAGLPAVDPARVAIGGASAGGGLAAALALLARDRGGITLVAQLLVYPMLDDRTVTRKGLDDPGHRLWNQYSNRFGWKWYLGDADPDVAVPARHEDLAGCRRPGWASALWTCSTTRTSCTPSGSRRPACHVTSKWFEARFTDSTESSRKRECRARFSTASAGPFGKRSPRQRPRQTARGRGVTLEFGNQRSRRRIAADGPAELFGGLGRTNGVGVSYRRVRAAPRTRRPARRCAKPSSRSGGRSRPRPSASESRLR